jgi:hypothetical protein
MPIEIRELVIRARIDPGGDQPPTSTTAPASEAADPGQELIQACVREVLRILEDKLER